MTGQDLRSRGSGADGLAFAAGFRPAHEVSGDIYDLFQSDDGRALLVLGDVSGKGAAAALYAALVSGLLHNLAPLRPQPAQLL